MASEHTKQRLAEGLKELTESRPFYRIRVSELCQRCGVDRRTFYYHFRDVYDLAAWIFNRCLEDNLIVRKQGFTAESVAALLRELQADQTFYRRALSEDSQNALGRHIAEHMFVYFAQMLKEFRGTETLSEEEKFVIAYHAVGGLIMIRQWLFADCSPSPEQLAQWLTALTPPLLRAAIGMEEKGGSTDA